jgi:hypothetical protein
MALGNSALDEHNPIVPTSGKIVLLHTATGKGADVVIAGGIMQVNEFVVMDNSTRRWLNSHVSNLEQVEHKGRLMSFGQSLDAW